MHESGTTAVLSPSDVLGTVWDRSRGERQLLSGENNVWLCCFFGGLSGGKGEGNTGPFTDTAGGSRLGLVTSGA